MRELRKCDRCGFLSTSPWAYERRNGELLCHACIQLADERKEPNP